MVQIVENPPAKWEIWVQYLGGERIQSLEEGMATHSSIFAWRISMDKGAWQAMTHKVAKSRTEVTWPEHMHTGS